MDELLDGVVVSLVDFVPDCVDDGDDDSDGVCVLVEVTEVLLERLGVSDEDKLAVSD